MSSQDGVKVCIRARPLIRREFGSECLWDFDTHQIKLKNSKDKFKSYIFDRVFGDDEVTSDVYEEIAQPIVQSAMQGFNGTVFAYGQTASGKTYTMLGSEEEPGVIPLGIKDVFGTIEKTPEREFLIRMSYLEIYNEALKDLLAKEVIPLSIREDEFRNVMVSGLTEKMITSPKDMMRFLNEGEKLRHMSATNMNDRSSRSHTIFRMVIESRERNDMNRTSDEYDTAVKVAQLNFVDLAGSERANQTGAEGQRLKEGCYINKSLTVLGQVINQICKANESGFAPYISFRDSRLTRILQPALGGNSLTAIICTVSLAADFETESTLRFASRAKEVKNKPQVNEVLSDEAVLFRQKREICELRTKVQEMEKRNEQNEITRLQKHELEEKIEKLTRMLLVSSAPADFSKKQQRSRRETWCPGAKRFSRFDSLKPSSMEQCRSEDISFMDHTSAIGVFDIEEKERLLDDDTFATRAPKRSLIHSPTSTKKARFENQFSWNEEQLQNTMALLNEEREMNNKLRKENQVLKENEVKMLSLQRELNDAKEQLKAKNPEALQAKICMLETNVKLQEDLIDQFTSENEAESAEKKSLQDKIEQLSQKIVELERREIARVEGDSVASVLKGQVDDLHEQLQDACRDKRRLQEKYDEETDNSRSLSLSIEQLSRDNDKLKAESANQIEEYKHKMHFLQSQLEATLSSTKNVHFSNNLQDTKEDREEKIQSKDQTEESLDGQNNKDVSQSTTVFKSINIGERTCCLEEAIQQCEILYNENESLKKKLDEMVFKVLEKDKDIEKISTNIDDLTSQVHALEEQAKFDQDEKEILFEEEKINRLKIKQLQTDLLSVKESTSENEEELKRNIQKLEAQLASGNQNEDVHALRKDLEMHSKTAKDAEDLLQDSNQRLSQANSQIIELEETVKSQASEMQNLQADLESYKTMLELSRKSNHSCSELERSIVGEQEQEVSDLPAQIELLNNEVDDLKAMLEKERSVVEQLQSIVDQLKSKEVPHVTCADNSQDDQTKTSHLAAENEELKESLQHLQAKLEDLQNKELQQQRYIAETENSQKESSAILQKQIHEAEVEINVLKQQLERQKIAENNVLSEKDTISIQHEKLQKQYDELKVQMEENSNAGENNVCSDEESANSLALTTKNMNDVISENIKLKELIQGTQGALLAECNKDLLQQRLLAEAEKTQKDVVAVFASERNQANLEIKSLKQQLEEKKMAEAKLSSEKDIISHQLDKMQQQCEELKAQVKNLEKSLDYPSSGSIFSFQNQPDPNKMGIKIKQLSLNLDLTQQKLTKLEETNKNLVCEIEKYKKCDQEQAELKTNLINQNASIDKLRHELEEKNLLSIELSGKLDCQNKELQNLQKKLEGTVASSSSLEKKVKDLEDVNLSYKDQLMRKQEEIGELQESKVSYSEKLSDLESRHKQEIDHLESELHETRNLVQQQLADIKTLNVNNEQLQSIVEENKQQHDVIKEEIVSLEFLIKEKDNQINEQNLVMNETMLKVKAQEEQLQVGESIGKVAEQRRLDYEALVMQHQEQVAQCECLKASLLEKDDSISSMARQIDDLKEKLKDHSNTLQSSTDDNAMKLEQLVSTKEADLASISSELNSAKTVISDLEKQLEDMKKSTAESNLEQMQLLEGQQHLSEVEKNFITLYHEFTQVNEKFEALSAASETANSSLEALQEEINAKTKLLEQLEQDREILQGDFETSNSNLDKEKAKVFSLEDQVETMRSHMLVLENTCQSDKTKIAALNSQIRQMECSIEEMTQETIVLKTEISDLKSSASTTTSEELKSKLHELQEETKHVEQLNSNLEQKTAEVHELSAQLSEITEELVSYKEKTNVMILEEKALKGQLQELGLEITKKDAEIENTCQSDKTKIAALNSQIRQMECLIEEMTQETIVLKTEISDLKSSASTTTSEELKSKLHELQEETKHVEQLNSNLEQKTAEVHELSAQLSEITEELVSYKEKTNVMTLEEKALKGQLQELELEITKKDAEIEELNLTNEAASQELSEMRKLTETFQTEVNTLKSALHDNDMQSQVKMEKLDNIQKSNEEYLEQIQVFEEKIRESEANVSQKQNEILTVQNQLQNSEQAHALLQDELKEKNEELNKINIMVAEIQKEYEILLSNSDVMQSRVGELEEQLREKTTQSVIKDDLLKTATSNVEKLEEQIKMILEQNDNANRKSEMMELKEEVDVLKLQNRRLINALERKNLHSAELEERIKSVNLDSEELQAEMVNLKKEVESFKVELEQQKNISKQRQTELDDLLQHKTLLESKLEDAERLLKAEQSNYKANADLVVNLQVKVDDLERVLTDDKSEQMKLLEDKDHLSDVEKNFMILFHEHTQLSASHGALSEELHEIKMSLERSEDSLLKKSAALDDLTSKYNIELEKQQNIEAEILTLRTKNEELQDEVADCNERISKAEQDMEVLRVSEKKKDMQLSRSSSLKILPVQLKLEKSQRENSELQQQIASMNKDHIYVKQLTQAKCSQLQQDLAAKDCKVKILTKDNENLRKKVEIYDTKFEKAVIESKDEIARERENNFQLYQLRVEELRNEMNADKAKQVEDLSAKLSTMEGDMTKTAEECETWKRKAAKRMDHIYELRKMIDDAEAEIEEYKEKLEVFENKAEKVCKNEDDSSIASGQDLKVNIAEGEIRKNYEKLDKIVKDQKTRIDELEATLGKHDKQMQNYKDKVKKQNQEISDYKEKIKNLDPPPISRVTRSAVSAGGFVQRTKLEVQQQKMIKLEKQLQFTEKELAKYKDIEETRKSENQRLADKCNAMKDYIREMKKKPAPEGRENIPPVSTRRFQETAQHEEPLEPEPDGCKAQ